jgi:hypothetical protein
VSIISDIFVEQGKSMWHFEYSVVGEKITKKQVWSVWSDVANWNKWDDDIESSEGIFSNNATLLIKPKKGPQVTASIVCEQDRSFTVRSKLPLGTKLEFSHFLTETPAGIKITHGVMIRGPLTFLFKYIIGKGVEKNLPCAMNKLLKIAVLK